jgi:hypothetical protein
LTHEIRARAAAGGHRPSFAAIGILAAWTIAALILRRRDSAV